MYKYYRKFIILVLICLCINLVECDPEWETLKVTWGIPMTAPNVFVKMPFTDGEAINEGFHQIGSQCSGEKFQGNRFWKTGDSLILIYDVTGYLAGIQTAIPLDLISQIKTKIRTVNSGAYQEETIEGKSYLLQTAYFIEPSRVCSIGRQLHEFQAEIGTDLYLQNGSDPIINSIRIPKFQSEVSTTSWTKGGCFPTMGQHYWFDITKDKDCSDFHPAFLLYNKGKLTGFGFANPGIFPGVRFEHPTKPILEKFIVPYPTCLDKEFDSIGGFSSTHYYFNARPENLQC